MSSVLVTGFITIDFIAYVDGFASTSVPEQATGMDVACGGRAANQAMALTAIEQEVALLARLGTDEHASLLLEELVDIGVDTTQVEQAPAQTGLRLINEQPDGQRQVTVYRGANDYLSVDDLNRRMEFMAEVGAIGVTTEPASAVVARCLEIARQAGVPSVLTHVPSSKPTSEALLELADIVVCSDTTCSGLLAPGVTQEHPEAALRALAQRGVGAAVLLTATRALLSAEGRVREVASPSPLDGEDAIDAFVAGLLQGLAAGDELEAAVLRGVRTGCLLVD